MPRLSAIDLAFFLLETDARPMNVGALSVFAPPAGAQRTFAATVVKGVLKRPVGPPFNYRLKRGPLAYLPQFQLSESIDPATQVHRVQLRRGADLKELFAKVCEIHVQRLPRDEPLWQLYVFSGLKRGRIALYFKTHHGLIDGIGFIRALTSTVSTSPRQRRPRAIWEGIPGATAARRNDKALARLLTERLASYAALRVRPMTSRGSSCRRRCAARGWAAVSPCRSRQHPRRSRPARRPDGHWAIASCRCPACRHSATPTAPL